MNSEQKSGCGCLILVLVWVIGFIVAVVGGIAWDVALAWPIGFLIVILYILLCPGKR